LISFLVRSLIGRLFSLVLILLIAGIAGWYFYIREDNPVQKEAAPVSDAVKEAAAATPTPPGAIPPTAAVSSSPTSSAAPAAASSIGTISYRIVEGQSLAWYLAPEKLSRLPTSSVAKGQTSDVKGEFHLTAEGLDPAKPTRFTVGVNTLKSEENQRDGRMRDALETTKFPTATFVATTLTGMPREFTATDAVMQLSGKLTVHGVEREVTWELKVKKDANILSGLATLKVKYTDFGMQKPVVAGFVTVEDELTLQVQLFATPS
jgi:polyisoprenoid-binding protein YceI